MDFKTRFQGKTSKITKDGGVDNAVLSNHSPIMEIDKIALMNP